VSGDDGDAEPRTDTQMSTCSSSLLPLMLPLAPAAAGRCGVKVSGVLQPARTRTAAPLGCRSSMLVTVLYRTVKISCSLKPGRRWVHGSRHGAASQTPLSC